MFIDTHCHIPMIIQNQSANSETTKPLTETEILKAQTVIIDAAQDHVTRFITIGTNVIESTNCCKLAAHYKEIFASVGLYPHECTNKWQADLKELEKLIARHEKVVAIGECGLDFHYPDYNKERQQDAFKAQIEIALKYNKALVVHTRQAPNETWNIVELYRHDLKRAVFHCFSEDLDFAREAVKNGYYIGVPCTITYPKNDRLRTVVSTLGLDCVVLETDAPYLPPQHMRGKANHPRHVATTAQFIAQLLEVTVEEVAQKTTINAQKLFADILSL